MKDKPKWLAMKEKASLIERFGKLSMDCLLKS